MAKQSSAKVNDNCNVIPINQHRAGASQEEREEKVVQGITTIVDRWAFIHRNAAPEHLTESQKLTHIKREVIKRLQESL